MRVLAVTKIFPNRSKPGAAPYNRHQLGALAKRARVEVAASIPWLPGRSLMGGGTAEIPRRDVIEGMPVTHPRVLYGPLVTRPASGALNLASLVAQLGHRRGDFDVVLGCFAYPDGWAAVGLARHLGAAAVIKVHGSDVNLLGADPLVRPLVTSAFRRAYAVVGPSQALIDEAVKLGADPASSRMVQNGTDRESFHPRDRRACREALGEPEERPWILFIGRVSVPKGALDLVEAFHTVHRRNPEARLVLIGDGVDTEAAKRAAGGLPVLFAGRRPPSEVPLWIGASDLLCLPSHNEGTPNVVLEALASGRRVVASNVGGIPAVMTDPAFGEMVDRQAPGPLAEALLRVLAEPYDRDALAARAPVIDWDASADQLHGVLEAAVADHRGEGRSRT